MVLVLALLLATELTLPLVQPVTIALSLSLAVPLARTMELVLLLCGSKINAKFHCEDKFGSSKQELS